MPGVNGYPIKAQVSNWKTVSVSVASQQHAPVASGQAKELC